MKSPLTFAAAMLALSACDSASKSPPAATPAAATPAGDTAPLPVVSPNHSVRRSQPDEVSTGRAPLASECEGDACGVVTVTWLDPGYRFENTGSRDVAIRIWFAAKGDCLLSEFSIAPAKSSGWGNTGFCKPYTAAYK
jgi:WD40 repeat protein